MDLEKLPLRRRRGADRRRQDQPRARARAAPRRRRAARAARGQSRSSRASTTTCARFALPTQLTFLFQRVDQLRGVAQLDMFRQPTVADFLLDKDPLFARLNLTDDEYALYEKVYAHLKPQTPTPDLVIYLQAPVDTLIERVQRRGVDFERRSPSELPRARSPTPTARYFYQYDDAPLLIVNSERLNFVDNPAHSRAAARRASPRCAAGASSSTSGTDVGGPYRHARARIRTTMGAGHRRRHPATYPSGFPPRLAHDARHAPRRGRLRPLPPPAPRRSTRSSRSGWSCRSRRRGHRYGRALRRAEAVRPARPVGRRRQPDRRRRRDRRGEVAKADRRLHAAVRRVAVHDGRRVGAQPRLRSDRAVRAGGADRRRARSRSS